jgi:hypothetical protein
MDHQSFEYLLLSDEPMSADQQKSIQVHLDTCESCRILATAWGEVGYQLHTASIMPPKSGFVGRWQENLEAYRQKKALRQSIFTLGITSVSAIFLFILFNTQLVLNFNSPAELLLAAADRLADLFSFVNASAEVLITLFRAFPGVSLLTLWVGFAALCSLSLLWIASIYQFTFQRRIVR